MPGFWGLSEPWLSDGSGPNPTRLRHTGEPSDCPFAVRHASIADFIRLIDAPNSQIIVALSSCQAPREFRDPNHLPQHARARRHLEGLHVRNSV